MKTRNAILLAVSATLLYSITVPLGCSKSDHAETPGNYTCACYLHLNNLIIDSNSKSLVNMKLSVATDSCDSFQRKAFHGAESTIGTSVCNIAN